MPLKKKRVSLTKAQVQAGIGAELLALCQTVTEDGSLSKEEIVEIRNWLLANRSSDLPAIDFLVATLERIVADGKVTKEERRELYQAIEKVLPPEARKDAVANRKVVEAIEKARIREEKEAARQQEREERDRRRPVFSANFMVAGVYYEGRPQVIRRYVTGGERVFLARNTQNKFSRNAVEIRLENGMQIGFLPEEYAVEAAPLLDQQCPHMAHTTKVLTAGRVPIPVVQAYVFQPDSGLAGLAGPSDVPAKQFMFDVPSPKRAQGTGCLGLIVLGALPAIVGSVLVAILR
jgi:hypothetical protein